MAAAFVDGFTANVVVERGSLRLVVRRPVRLGVWLRSVVHAVLALVLLACALLAGREFWTHIADQRALDRAEVYALLRSSPPVFRGERRHVTLTRAHPDGPIEAIFGGPDVDLDAGSPAARALGCGRVVRQPSARSPIREIYRFEDLLARCELTQLRTAAGAEEREYLQGVRHDEAPGEGHRPGALCRPATGPPPERRDYL